MRKKFLFIAVGSFIVIQQPSPAQAAIKEGDCVTTKDEVTECLELCQSDSSVIATQKCVAGENNVKGECVCK